MKKIQRPTTVAEVGMTLHFAEFFLTLALDALTNIVVSPEHAAPEPLYGRAKRSGKLVLEALAIIGEEDES